MIFFEREHLLRAHEFSHRYRNAFSEEAHRLLVEAKTSASGAGWGVNADRSLSTRTFEVCFWGLRVALGLHFTFLCFGSPASSKEHHIYIQCLVSHSLFDLMDTLFIVKQACIIHKWHSPRADLHSYSESPRTAPCPVSLRHTSVEASARLCRLKVTAPRICRPSVDGSRPGFQSTYLKRPLSVLRRNKTWKHLGKNKIVFLLKAKMLSIISAS